MKITCIADLHGFYPKLPGGDLLIVAGDLTARDREEEYWKCFGWIEKQPYLKKILVAGNHDNLMQRENYKGPAGPGKGGFTYLCDSGVKWKGLKIWGTPWTQTFEFMNPHCKAFTLDTESELNRRWCKIPKDTDILVCHCPPFSFLDQAVSGDNVGSRTLAFNMATIPPLKLVVCGHVHEGYGQAEIGGIKIINASLVNEHYKPVNAPVTIEL